MNTVHLTDAELALTRQALHSFLVSFGHDEADTVEAIKRLIAKFGAPGHDTEEAVFIG